MLYVFFEFDLSRQLGRWWVKSFCRQATYASHHGSLIKFTDILICIVIYCTWFLLVTYRLGKKVATSDKLIWTLFVLIIGVLWWIVFSLNIRIERWPILILWIDFKHLQPIKCFRLLLLKIIELFLLLIQSTVNIALIFHLSY